MTIFFVLLALAAIGVIAVLAAGRIGQLEDPVVDRYRPEIPLAPLAATDLENLRFGTGLRGYRMSDVDEAIGRLTETLRIREAQLAAYNPQLNASESSTEGAPTNRSDKETDGSPDAYVASGAQSDVSAQS
mgnify:FL=1